MAEIHLPRGLYNIQGKPILICPSVEQIKRINNLPIAAYLSIIGQAPELIDEQSYKDPYEIFSNKVLDPLQERLLADEGIKPYSIDDIGIRGTACSLEGELSFKKGTQRLVVRSLEQILREGTDSGEQTTGLAPVSDLDGFPAMYLRSTPLNFRVSAAFYSGAQDDSYPIFPLLIIYNKSLMSFDNRSSRYIMGRRNPIVRAFVLDYHTSRSP